MNKSENQNSVSIKDDEKLFSVIDLINIVEKVFNDGNGSKMIHEAINEINEISSEDLTEGLTRVASAAKDEESVFKDIRPNIVPDCVTAIEKKCQRIEENLNKLEQKLKPYLNKVEGKKCVFDFDPAKDDADILITLKRIDNILLNCDNTINCINGLNAL